MSANHVLNVNLPDDVNAYTVAIVNIDDGGEL